MESKRLEGFLQNLFYSLLIDLDDDEQDEKFNIAFHLCLI